MSENHDLRLDWLETEMHDIKAVLGRLEPLIRRIDQNPTFWQWFRNSWQPLAVIAALWAATMGLLGAIYSEMKHDSTEALTLSRDTHEKLVEEAIPRLRKHTDTLEDKVNTLTTTLSNGITGLTTNQTNILDELHHLRARVDQSPPRPAVLPRR